MSTLIRYVSKENPFNFVNILEDDRFVIIGDLEVSDDELHCMVGGLPVDGFIIEDDSSISNSTVLKRAKRNGDRKFIKMYETHVRYTKGFITKDQAINILGESYRDTVTTWP